MKYKFLISLIVGAFLVACSPSYQPTPTPVPPTSTPVPLPTSVPSPTSVPTIMMKGNGVAVTVPDTYVNADPEILEDLLGYSGLLCAYDTKPSPSGNFAKLCINKAPPSVASGVEEVLLDFPMSLLVEDYKDRGATDIEVKNCVHGNNECIAVTYILPQEGVTWRMLQYWIREDVDILDIYTLAFAADISEFPQRYDEFSQIFNSFQILEE